MREIFICGSWVSGIYSDLEEGYGQPVSIWPAVLVGGFLLVLVVGAVWGAVDGMRVAAKGRKR